MGKYWCTFSFASLATISVSLSSTGKLGKPCERLMALYSVAIFDIIVNMLVPICGSLLIEKGIYYYSEMYKKKSYPKAASENKS
jgi:hypothetical protein